MGGRAAQPLGKRVMIEGANAAMLADIIKLFIIIYIYIYNVIKWVAALRSGKPVMIDGFRVETKTSLCNY